MSRTLRLLVLAAAASLAPVAAQALPEHTWVVAIGNNHGDAGDIGLLYAQHDATEFADVLRQLGKVSSRRTMLLMNENADTIRRAILDVNTAIRRESNRAESTALIVYYSGHADATALHLEGTDLAFDELKALLESSPAGMRLLIVDACRSGNVTRVKGVSPAASFRIDVRSEVAPEGMAIITSSAADESSQESDQLRGSFFTHHLVNALRGAADKNGDGLVTLTEAYAYAYSNTLRSSGQTMQLQHPTYSWSVKGRDQLILSAPGEAQGKMGRLRYHESANYLIMEKHEGGPIFAEVSPQGDQGEVLLPAGQYFVQQRERSEYKEYQIKLKEGGMVDLGSTPFHAIRYDQLVRKRGGGAEFTHNLTLMLGAQGGMLGGEGVVPEVQVGYGVDLSWGTLGLRASGTTTSSSGGDGLLPQRHDEFGLGITLQRYIDFEHVSLAFGVLVEGLYNRQSFTSSDANPTPARNSWGAGFGAIFTAEKHINSGFAVRLEGGPISAVFQQAAINQGVQTGHALATPLTWWLAGGLVWRH